MGRQAPRLQSTQSTILSPAERGQLSRISVPGGTGRQIPLEGIRAAMSGTADQFYAAPWAWNVNCSEARAKNALQEMKMEQSNGLQQKHEIGKISQIYGNRLISALRSEHGADFAPGASPNARLSHVINVLDERSLHKLVERAR